MTKEATKNKPELTLRDGELKATFWKSSGEKGDFLSVTFSRTYTDNGQPRDTQSFSGTALLRLARLAELAYDQDREFRAQARLEPEG